jgi:hypothetical protein
VIPLVYARFTLRDGTDSHARFTSRAITKFTLSLDRQQAQIFLIRSYLRRKRCLCGWAGTQSPHQALDSGGRWR